MKRFLILSLITGLILSLPAGSFAQNKGAEYTIGVDDILDINVLKPEELTKTVTVAPDGAITFPYIGSVVVKGHTIAQIQDEIQSRLADGYMKYPVVSVSLKESLSRKFSVSGDVLKPGAYPIEENTTLLKAISIAGGFVGYGPSSQVKVLRPKKDGAGNEIINVNIKNIMSGDSAQELLIQTGDAIEVTEGKFSVYGEVIKPGSYPMEENMTVLRAISMAGGFTKFGSSSRVKVLRAKKTGVGYKTIPVNIKRVMDGDSDEDVVLKQGDIVTVSEGVF